MPIIASDKEALAEQLDMLDPLKGVAVARLVYDTILSARTQPGGLSYEATLCLGRLVYDKAPWDLICRAEQAMAGRHPIRLPIVQAADVHFRRLLPDVLRPTMPAGADILSACLSAMDANELSRLATLLYSTLVEASFAVDSTMFGGMHPFAKFLMARWSWDDLKKEKSTLSGICLPLARACLDHLGPKLPWIFDVEHRALPEIEPETGDKDGQGDAGDGQTEPPVNLDFDDPEISAEDLFGEPQPWPQEDGKGKKKKNRKKNDKNGKSDRKEAVTEPPQEKETEEKKTEEKVEKPEKIDNEEQQGQEK